MSKPLELKLGQFHYKLNESTGFWESQIPTYPEHSAFTYEELTAAATKYLIFFDNLIKVSLTQRDEFSKQLEELKSGI